MLILITGAGGFIGSALTTALPCAGTCGARIAARATRPHAALGVPAFLALVVVFWLMIAKPA